MAKQTYPKKVCDVCDNLVQLHFDPLREWGKTKFVNCPRCRSSLFPQAKSLSIFVTADMEIIEDEEIDEGTKRISEERCARLQKKRDVLWKIKKKKRDLYKQNLQEREGKKKDFTGKGYFQHDWGDFVFKRGKYESLKESKRRYKTEWTNNRRKQMRKQYGRILY